MTSSRPRRRVALGRALGAAMLAAAIGVGCPVPAGAVPRGQSFLPTMPFSIAGRLAGAAATSVGNAWAVGSTGSFLHPRPLIVHWNGTRWTQMPSASLPGGELNAVAATSADNAWAVGGISSGQGLIVHWDGSSWKRVASPGAAGSLTGVGASSAANVWAVGSGTGRAVILHWNGSRWTQVPGPSLRGSVSLTAVAVFSGRSAWAVGAVYTTSAFSATSLILHWNGTRWQRVPIPSPAEGRFGNGLAAVAAASATSAWAVGCTDGCPVGGTPLIERWNGISWTQVAAPTTPYSLYNLAGVAVISAGSAWAVGGGGPATSESAAAAYWNGRSWTLSPGIAGAGLAGVAAVSATSAWAVGGTASGRTLILHWNGHDWS